MDRQMDFEDGFERESWISAEIDLAHVALEDSLAWAENFVNAAFGLGT